MPGEPDFTHSSGSQPRNQPVTADRTCVVQQFFVDLEHRAFGDEDRALENGLQLPNVSGPVVAAQPPHRLRRRAFDRLPKLPGVPADEVFDERRDVLSPIFERWHGDLGSAEQRDQRRDAERLSPVDAMTRTSGSDFSPPARAAS